MFVNYNIIILPQVSLRMILLLLLKASRVKEYEWYDKLLAKNFIFDFYLANGFTLATLWNHSSFVHHILIISPESTFLFGIKGG